MRSGAALLLTLAVLFGSGRALSDEPPAEAENVCVRGQLTDEGIECPALRSEDHSLYTLVGETALFDVGDHVCVCGAVAEVSFCMQGTTITVTHISPSMERCVP
jgi:hypothetical protein